MAGLVAPVGDKTTPVQAAMEPSAIIIVLLDDVGADQTAAAPPDAGAPSAPNKGHGLDFYA